MKQSSITVQEFVKRFGLIVLCGFENLTNKHIDERPLSRPGFELSGFYEATDKKRLVLFGNKEMVFINNQEKKDKRLLLDAYEFLTSEECPAIVFCRNLKCPPELLEIAKKKNFPILSTSMTTSGLQIKTITYLQEVLAPKTSLHGSLVEIYSCGVLIMGESGIGKSETTLELVKKGHRFISDDRVNISAIRGELIGEAPELLHGVMEVRGIGIIDVGRIFGLNSLMEKAKIDYVIELIPFRQEDAYDRLGNSVKSLDILGHNVPLLVLPVFGARSIAEIVEVAVTNMKLKAQGFDSTFEFENRMNELLLRKRGK